MREASTFSYGKGIKVNAPKRNKALSAVQNDVCMLDQSGEIVLHQNGAQTVPSSSAITILRLLLTEPLTN